jgi:hypothetical protein
MREIVPGLWRWTAPHPDWQGDPELPRDVGSVAYETSQGVVLIDPLVEDWGPLETLVAGRPVSVLLTVPWHERSAREVGRRFPEGGAGGEIEAIPVNGVGGDEVLYWLPGPRALVTGDLIVGVDGGLRVQDGWLADDRRGEKIRSELRPLLLGRGAELVLPAHGEPILDGAEAALAAALG